MSGPIVLIVDDELAIRRLLRATLERANYAVIEAATAREALEAAGKHHPDLVLLDLGLPDRDGLELVPLLKRAGGPAMIVVSARETTDDKVAALDLGADDYVAKPFDTDELLARLRVAVRHRVNGPHDAAPLTAGDVTIELARRRITRNGEEVHLTRKEHDVLATLARAPGRIVTHKVMLKAGWPREADPPIEYVRLVVRNLRQKLEANPSRPMLIVNELGVGYRLCNHRDGSEPQVPER